MRIGTLTDLKTIHDRIRAAVDKPAEVRRRDSFLEVTDSDGAVFVFRVAGRLRPTLASMGEPDCSRQMVRGLDCGTGGLRVQPTPAAVITAFMVGLGGMP